MNSSDVAEVEELSEAEFMLPYTPCFFLQCFLGYSGRGDI